MFVNPFERMKKKREEKERIDKETQEEREKYARLGVQMGLTDAGGKVPSFMQGIMGEEKKQNVPPFGMSVDSDDYGSSMPMPSSPAPKSKLSNDSLKDLSLPGGAGAAPKADKGPSLITPDDNGFITPDRPSLGSGDMFDNFAPQAPMTEPSSEPHSLGSEPSPMPQFSSAPPISNNVPAFGGFDSTPTPAPSAPISTPVSPSSNSLEAVEYDSSFFAVEQNALDQIDALLNLNTTPINNIGDISAIIDELNNEASKKQFFAIFGDIAETKACTTAIVDATNLNPITIEMKKMYSYTTPFLYVLKAIINGLETVSVDDKRALWDRVAIFLSATSYGKQGTEIELIFEEELALADPMESAKDEFRQAFAAYDMTDKNILINLTDFRGLDFADMNNSILFVTDLFLGIANMKFLFELPYDSYISHFRLSASKSWMQLFDIVNNTKADEEEATEATEENVFSEIQQGVAPSTPAPVIPPSAAPLESAPPGGFTPQPMTSEMPPSAAPAMPFESFDSNAPRAEETSFSSPISGGGFVPPGSASNNAPQSHGAVAEVKREVDPKDDAIRIRIDEMLKKKEREKQEAEEFERQQNSRQLIEATIDPSVLVDEDVVQGAGDGSPLDIFANFNAAGYSNFIKEDARRSHVERDPNIIQDERPYEEIVDKLINLNQDLQSQSNINVGAELSKRGPDGREKEPEPVLKVPGSWGQLN
jgi:hypothetical protein